MTQALVAAPLVLAIVLAGAGAAKLSDDDARVAMEWDLMRAPKRLNRRWLRRAHPWSEILLGGALLVSNGILGALVACGALILCIAYTVLVIQAMKVPGATCSCFGSERAAALTWRTVLRNVLLVLLALVAVISATYQGSPLAQAMDTPTVMTWEVAIVVAMTVAYLIADSGEQGRETSTRQAVAGSSEDRADPEVADYVRTLTPRARVREADGTPVDLYRVSQGQAQLLLFVAPGCVHCEAVASHISEWTAAMPQIGIHFVVAGTASQLRDRRPEWVEYAWYDYDRAAAQMLQCDSTPSAVLLGTDGMLAGGPVSGDLPVLDFVDEVLRQLV